MLNLPHEEALLKMLLTLLGRVGRGRRMTPDVLLKAQLTEEEAHLLVALLALAMPSLPFDVIEEMPDLPPIKERLLTALEKLSRERVQKLLKEDADDPLASEVAMVVASSLASGRVMRVMVNSGLYQSLSLPALVAYVNQVIPHYIEESPRVTALAKRDDEAWQELREWLIMRSYTYLRPLKSSEAASAPSAEDFSQDVCLVLLEKLSQYYYDAEFDAWVSTILHNIVYHPYMRGRDIIDRNPLVASLEQPLEKGAEVSLGESLSDPHQAVSLTRIALYFELAKLSEREREVLLYFYIYGLLDQETAPRMGIAEGSVAVLRWRTLRKLRNILGDG